MVFEKDFIRFPSIFFRFDELFSLAEAWKEAPAERPSLPDLVQALKKMEVLRSQSQAHIGSQRSCSTVYDVYLYGVYAVYNVLQDMAYRRISYTHCLKVSVVSLWQAAPASQCCCAM